MEIALARLIGVGLDGIFTVLYTGLFTWAMYTLWRRNKVNPYLPAALIAMFLLHTTQFILQLIDNYNAFVVYRDHPGPTAYFNDCANVILPIRDACFWLICIMSDCLIVWRLHVVWSQSRRVIVIPLVILTSAITTGVVMFVHTVQRAVEGTPRLNHTIELWWMATLGLMIILNLLAPGLIVYRLWHLSDELDSLGSVVERSPYKRLALSLVESGALYSLALLVWLIIFASGYLPALYMSACILPSIVAIVPVLIVIRLNAIAADTGHAQSGYPTQSETLPNPTFRLQHLTHHSDQSPNTLRSDLSLEEGAQVSKKDPQYPLDESEDRMMDNLMQKV
ncbi:hypothetical protein FRC03_006680 [Tulasnella sp. 419]|nr:hypothetical protein FRC03_006680 [Tulasnella sp. 419]